MNDLLTAESILFAIIIALYGFWYPEIRTFLDLPIPKHHSDHQPECIKANEILHTKMNPLMAILFITSIIFIPDAIKITVQSLKLLRMIGLWQYVFLYDAVNTAYVFFCILTIVLTFNVIGLFLELKSKKKKLSEK